MTQNAGKHESVRFLEMLYGVADVTQTKVSQTVVELYLDALAPYGYDKAVAALKIVAMDAKPGRGFPSISDIIKAIDPSKAISSDDQANDVANRILKEVARSGGYNFKRAQEALGDVAWDVVEKAGGWSDLCSSLDEESRTTTRAQLRDLARSHINRLKAGISDRPVTRAEVTGSSDEIVKRLAEATRF